MKKFRVYFIGALLILAMVLCLGLAYGGYKFSYLVLSMTPQFYNMHVPMLVLCEAMVLCLVIGLVFGFLALESYGRDQIFDRKMLFYLQGTSLSFVGICILAVLAIVFTNFNLDGSITNLAFMGLFLLALLLNQVFLLLADLIRQGMTLKEENDLTI